MFQIRSPDGFLALVYHNNSFTLQVFEYVDRKEPIVIRLY